MEPGIGCDLDWNPIANTIGNIGVDNWTGREGNPVATRVGHEIFAEKIFWLIARETAASVLATCQKREKSRSFVFNWEFALISANFARSCQSAPLTRGTMKISSNERVIKEPLVLGSWTESSGRPWLILRDFLCVSRREFCSIPAYFDR